MRTNIVLNDELVKKAFQHSSARTKRELVHEALEELISARQRRDLGDLRGKISSPRATITRSSARERDHGPGGHFHPDRLPARSR